MKLRSILPPFLRSTLGDVVDVRKNRKKNEYLKREHPAGLRTIHIEGLETLLDRDTLLRRMPKGLRCAEVGVAEGDFSRSILDLMAPAQLHLIDLWDANSDRYKDSMQPALDKVAKELAAGIAKVHRGYSWEMIDQLPHQSIDWIYIDAAHDYDSVRKDLNAALSKMKAGGWICGHDYTRWAGSGLSRWGVREAVNEFCVEHNWRFRYLTFETHGHVSYALQQI